MRNAAAHFDDDLGYDEPARRKAPRKPRSAGKTKARSAGKTKARKKKGRHFSVDMHKVARYAAIGMSATLAIGIMVNALVMQRGHHAAPLFKTTITLADTPITPAPVKMARESVPDAVVPPDATKGAIAPVPVPVVKPHNIATVAAKSDQAGGEDQIAKLLQGGTPPAGDKSEAKTITAAQKALAKLGFALKPNGTLGPATKKAIEQFEKERNLPVNGELTRRVVKVLSAESGLRID